MARSLSPCLYLGIHPLAVHMIAPRLCVSVLLFHTDPLVTIGDEKPLDGREAKLPSSTPIPRNKSAGNLGVPKEYQESTSTRYSFDSSQLGLDSDAFTRWVTQPSCRSLAGVIKVKGISTGRTLFTLAFATTFDLISVVLL